VLTVQFLSSNDNHSNFCVQEPHIPLS